MGEAFGMEPPQQKCRNARDGLAWTKAESSKGSACSPPLLFPAGSGGTKNTIGESVRTSDRIEKPDGRKR